MRHLSKTDTWPDGRGRYHPGAASECLLCNLVSSEPEPPPPEPEPAPPLEGWQAQLLALADKWEAIANANGSRMSGMTLTAYRDSAKELRAIVAQHLGTVPK